MDDFSAFLSGNRGREKKRLIFRIFRRIDLSSPPKKGKEEGEEIVRSCMEKGNRSCPGGRKSQAEGESTTETKGRVDEPGKGEKGCFNENLSQRILITERKRGD